MPRGVRGVVVCVMFLIAIAARPGVAFSGPEPAPADAVVAPADVEPGPTGEPAAAAAPEPGADAQLDEPPPVFPDPYEGMNRQTFAFNQRVDGWLIGPLADAYESIVPGFVRTGLRNFFVNLAMPAQLVNDVLQGELCQAGSTVARFAINTVSSAGLVDTASSLGLEAHRSDFGETLARSGVGSGPYIVVPVLGPTTARDGIGTIVDTALNPTIYLLAPLSPLAMASIQGGAYGFTERAAHGEDLRELRATSVDYYAAFRSAYSQQRMAKTGESHTPGGPIESRAPGSSVEARVPNPSAGPPT